MAEVAGKWSDAWQIAAVYVGTVVGAGFATGKEIIEFFTQYGTSGTIGIIISGSLFTWGGVRMMVMARKVKAASYQQFNRYLFGKAMSPVISIMMTLMIIGVTAVMMAGAGAVFEEQLGLPRQIGIVATLCLSLLVMMYDIKGLFGVNALIVPMMVLFSAIALGKLITMGEWCGTGLEAADYSLKAFLSPFSYAAFNLAMAQPVLVPLACEAEDERTVRRGAVLGGLLLTGILLSSHFVLLSFPYAMNYDIPMAEVIRSFFAVFYWVYIIVIYGEIFTSIIGGIFGLQRQARTLVSIPNTLFLAVLFIVLYIVSLFRYSELLSFLYPLFGYISFAFLFLLWARKVPRP
ncbi:hypothetical protein IC801_01055 [Geobacillus sp. 44B]|uniref:YkvI family membrane protein n=1 Tax=Saccharococcus caldoxylosilyticus TaxID=81408 RepID=UPI00030BD974|nr:membrane protein [Parageobacillus caldoxylosilyticus]OQP03202.1 hypothetical protein BSK33_07905 [Geobacillus sp. 44B]QNU37982.1 hypothetical protein IC801_01055 [Geobacillus sp. 44B]